jgi:hypothetical protein
MLRNTFSFLLTLSFFAGLLGCSTDLEVNAPNQEKTVIYSILNPRQPFQVARISKGFLNEGKSALDIAKNDRDSILYDTNEILVELIQFYPNIAKAEKKWLMTPYFENNKEEGIFYSPDQLLYKTPNIKLDTQNLSDVRYKLRVTRKITNHVSEGITELAGNNFDLYDPILEGSISSPRAIAFSSKRGTSIKFKRPVNVSLSECIFIWTIEVTRLNNEKFTEVWEMTSPGKLGDGENTEQIFGQVGVGEFFRFLKQEALERGNADVLQRRFISGQLKLTGASSEYKKYKDVNSNYNPITQSTPTYTNVSKGLGVVCSINQRFYSVFLDASTMKEIKDFVPEFKLGK